VKRPLVFSIGPKGDDTARHIAQLLASPVHFCGQGREDAARLVLDAYAARSPVIGVCAAGMLIRLVGPDLGERTTEPPVLAVSADGKTAVPLLGVHRGANALARWIAEGFRGTAAVTSLSDTLYDFALDDPPPGYVLANPDAAKPILAALMNGEALRVDGPSGWLSIAGYPIAADGSQRVRVSETLPEGKGLHVFPKTLVVGMGCTSSAPAEDAIALVAQTLASANLSPKSLAVIATLDARCDAPAIRAVADHFGIPVRGFSKRELGTEKKRLVSPSDTVEQAVGLAGVCEAAALKAGALVVPKQVSAQTTCAIGRAETPVMPETFGHPPANR
jgi:cobalamin biosynthesis protein CbiG